MAIRDISVIIDNAGSQPAAVAAAELARRFDAHLVGIALAYDPVVPGYGVAPVPADFMVEARERAIDEAKVAASAFGAIAERAGIAAETRITDVLTGGGLDGLVAQLHFSDLVVIGQDDADHSEPMRDAVIEGVLFNAGLPALLIPRKGAPTIPLDRVVVAWDGSTTAAKAVRAAMPVLERAKAVDVVIVGEDLPEGGEPGADVAAHLARHGVPVTIRTVADTAGDIAATLRQAVLESGADLLVMGGYGHSRLREWVFGGVTRSMLDTMTVPVLMAR
ncbi:universal stress protein [Prosthecomicrobium pneumaticum]|uniref:Nucleotide-binding universal stress UspA family protein n=1 Tax=Prosthecomicrobium pneumaticum TaxID=81895 RepID=A0A7W9CUH6_9HYPH|nr:universal stress protein [Prosthecomicrobium pneumaticum]MBB5752160.1 nucleotide-binding universal stress UspA family protein [Prosthecomicrobium pneumaticum]